MEKNKNNEKSNEQIKKYTLEKKEWLNGRAWDEWDKTWKEWNTGIKKTKRKIEMNGTSYEG